jgi:3-methylcrotonyl-CoA carboxylase alpha subunit
MFDKLLIANRGEIACRIARTARRLGVRTVAIYSEADANARHVALADEAWPVGSPSPKDSYLAGEKIIDVARRSGAQAVHPGYGFLAENADFAEACARAGLTFVGPPPQAMRLMGDKAAAKATMGQMGVPILPGVDAADGDAPFEAAETIGFPLLVKARAGGGGRGMRIVRAKEEFADALAAARREAIAAFGDGGLILERYLERARHIEVQVFADAHGDAVAFPERDCSMQRHHQKVLEETPALGLAPGLPAALRLAALTAVRAVGYVGAGTVEFLVQGDAFYFLEMNARLQVEHPITEMIADLDLVEWQLRVACGGRLPLGQESLMTRGWAMEARICAEDPTRDFLPSVGVLEHFRFPEESAALRADSGVRAGDRVSPYYDSLLAKLIVWGADRPTALRQLRRALEECEIVGVTTNLDFLRALVDLPEFTQGAYDTGVIERELNRLVADVPRVDDALLFAAGAAAWWLGAGDKARRRAETSDDPHSPWAVTDAWRLHDRGAHELCFDYGGRRLSARLTPLGDGAFRLETPTGAITVETTEKNDRLRLRVDGVEREMGLVRRQRGVVVIVDGGNHALDNVDAAKPASQIAAADALLSAPVPARVTRVFVEAGESVRKGAPLVVLEAMKMEFALTAPRDGEIAEIHCAVGEMTLEGAQLVTFVEEKPA